MESQCAEGIYFATVCSSHQLEQFRILNLQDPDNVGEGNERELDDCAEATGSAKRGLAICLHRAEALKA